MRHYTTLWNIIVRKLAWPVHWGTFPELATDMTYERQQALWRKQATVTDFIDFASWSSNMKPV